MSATSTSNNPEIAVLAVLLRFARSPRRLGPSSLANVVSRVGAEPAVVHRALASLARQGLVLRSSDREETVRLSLPGLAVAVACAGAAAQKAKPRASIVAKPRLPLRRRRAA